MISKKLFAIAPLAISLFATSAVFADEGKVCITCQANASGETPNIKLSASQIAESLKNRKHLNYGLSYDDEISEDVVKSSISVLLYVADHPPSDLKNHLFDWKADQATVREKMTQIHLLTSTSKEGRAIRDGMRNSSGGMSESTDALTAVSGAKASNKVNNDVYIFVDLIAKDKQGKMRNDFISRLMVILAHEIYGNVQSSLETDFTSFGSANLEKRKEHERRAFKAGIRFIETLQTTGADKKLSLKLQKDLKQRMVEEKAALASWER